MKRQFVPMKGRGDASAAAYLLSRNIAFAHGALGAGHGSTMRSRFSHMCMIYHAM
jgi:hypothetical protein